MYAHAHAHTYLIKMFSPFFFPNLVEMHHPWKVLVFSVAEKLFLLPGFLYDNYNHVVCVTFSPPKMELLPTPMVCTLDLVLRMTVQVPTIASLSILPILRFSLSASLLISFFSLSIFFCSRAFSLAISSCLCSCFSCKCRACSFSSCCKKNCFLFASLSFFSWYRWESFFSTFCC